MAKVKGSAGKVKNGSNTVAGVRRFSYERTMEPIDDSDLNTEELTYVPGDITGTGTVECFWDKSDTTGQETLVVGAVISMVLYPEGDGVGGESHSFSALITSEGMANEKQNMVTKTIGFQISGTVTKA